MGFRFFRRIRLAPGLTLNLSKRGGSLSFGPRGAKITAGTSGIRRTIGLPGTGLWYTEKVGGRSSGRSGRSQRSRSRQASANDDLPPTPTVRPPDRLTLSFFKRLVIPKGEEHFVDGMRHAVLGDDCKAVDYLRQAVHLADAAFMAGMLALKLKRYDEAAQYLGYARQQHTRLGRYFAKYGIDASVSLPITERISAQVGPNTRGILLALAEVHQALGDWRQAIRELHELHQHDPSDVVVKLSLCEILVEELGEKRALQQVVKLSKDVTNDSEIQAAVLLWKGKALRLLGLHTAARDTLTTALRRTKDRSNELLRALRYQRALVYEAMGQSGRSRQQLEKLYAEAPDYEDVAERLGLVMTGS